MLCHNRPKSPGIVGLPPELAKIGRSYTTHRIRTETSAWACFRTPANCSDAVGVPRRRPPSHNMKSLRNSSTSPEIAQNLAERMCFWVLSPQVASSHSGPSVRRVCKNGGFVISARGPVSPLIGRFRPRSGRDRPKLSELGRNRRVSGQVPATLANSHDGHPRASKGPHPHRLVISFPCTLLGRRGDAATVALRDARARGHGRQEHRPAHRAARRPTM